MFFTVAPCRALALGWGYEYVTVGLGLRHGGTSASASTVARTFARLLAPNVTIDESPRISLAPSLATLTRRQNGSNRNAREPARQSGSRGWPRQAVCWAVGPLQIRQMRENATTRRACPYLSCAIDLKSHQADGWYGRTASRTGRHDCVILLATPGCPAPCSRAWINQSRGAGEAHDARPLCQLGRRFGRIEFHTPLLFVRPLEHLVQLLDLGIVSRLQRRKRGR